MGSLIYFQENDVIGGGRFLHPVIVSSKVSEMNRKLKGEIHLVRKENKSRLYFYRHLTIDKKIWYPTFKNMWRGL